MNGWELIHRRESREFECVVAIGYTFNFRPSPRFAIGVGNEVWLLQFVAKIGQPTGGGAGFEHENICVVLLDELCEISSQRVDGGEFVRIRAVRVAIVNAGDCLEFSEVECKNLNGRANLSTCVDERLPRAATSQDNVPSNKN